MMQVSGSSRIPGRCNRHHNSVAPRVPHAGKAGEFCACSGNDRVIGIAALQWIHDQRPPRAGPGAYVMFSSGGAIVEASIFGATEQGGYAPS